MRKGKTIPEYTILRVLATLFVIFGHAMANNFTTEWFGVRTAIAYTGTAAALLAVLSDYIYKFHMPLFFFLAGALLKYTGAADKSFEEIIPKRFRRLMVPYIGCLLLYSLPVKVLTGIYNLPTAAYITTNIFLTTEYSGYLWFLYRLFVVTVFVWLLARYCMRRRPALGAAVILVCLFACVKLPVAFVLTVPAVMLLYTFLGYLFEYVRPRLTAAIQKYWYAAVLAVAAYGLWNVKGRILRVPLLGADNGYFAAMQDIAATVFPVLLDILAWYAIACLLSAIPRLAECRALRSLDENSMYIYLFHDPLNYLIMAAAGLLPGWVVGPAESLALIALRTVGILLVSWAVSPLLHRLDNDQRVVRWAMLICGLIFTTATVWVYAANLIP
ncbi:MAG: acyltransferase [Oscillospiraceae bacterium]|nr:acyltransferase [Oscillospiraceae bacterium]